MLRKPTIITTTHPFQDRPRPMQGTSAPSVPAWPPERSADGYEVRFWQKTIWLSGSIRTQTEAEELIAAINALKPMLGEPDTSADEQSS